MNIPEDLRYTKDHEWVRIEGDNTAIVGITDYAQKELGDIVYVDVDTEGDEVERNETFGTVEAVKTVSDLIMPLSGTVDELNETLDGEPELVNSDPYGKGWMIKITMANAAEVDELLTPEQYRDEIGA